MSNRMDVIKRDDSDFEITFKDIDGNPIDLTDCTVFFTVKKKKSNTDAEAIIEKEITSFVDPELGILILSLSNEETDIQSGDYYFDIQLKDELGRIASSSTGKFLVSQDITIRTDVDNGS